MKNLFLLFLLLISFTTKSQNSINGKIVDESNNPIFAVNVYLNNRLDIGCISDFDGKFYLEIDTINQLDTLVFSFIGFQTHFIPLQELNLDNLTIKLKKSANIINDVIISGKRPISYEFAIEELDKMDIYLNPSSAADPLKAVTSSAGSTNTEETANLNLRGSSFKRSIVYFNDVPIYNPVRNSQINGTGFFSIFNTGILDKEYIYFSNPPLAYGNSTAGLVSIETIENLKNSSFTTSIGLGGISFFSSTKLNDNSFVQWYGNLRQFGLLKLLHQTTFKNINTTNSFDQGVNYHINFSEKTNLNIYNYFSTESYNVKAPLSYTSQIDAIGKTKRNFTILNLNHRMKNSIFKLNYLFDITNKKYSLGNLKSNAMDIFSYASFSYKHYFENNFQLETGVNHNYRQYSSADSIPVFYYAIEPQHPSFFYEGKAFLNNLEYFLYGKYSVNKKLSLSAGYRFGFPFASKKTYHSFQFSTAYLPIKNNNIIFSLGYYNANVKTIERINFEKQNSFQSSIDYKIKFTKKIKSIINLGVFYKREGLSHSIGELFSNNNYTDLYGIDLKLSYKVVKNLIFNFNYSYLKPVDYINGTKEISKYNLNYFIKSNIQYSHPKLFTISVDYVLRNGLNYTPITQSSYNHDLNLYEPVYSEKRNSASFKSYNNISILVSKYIATKKNTYIIYASVSNVFNFKNEQDFIYNRDYSSKKATYYSGRLFYIGATFSFK